MTASDKKGGGWLFGLAALVTALLGSGGVIGLINSWKQDPQPSPSPTTASDPKPSTPPDPVVSPSPPIKPEPIASESPKPGKSCVGVNIVYYSEFYFYPNQPPLGVAAIASVNAGQPAASSGLQAGDIILEVNGQRLSSQWDMSEIIGSGKYAYVRIFRPTAYSFNNNGMTTTPPYQDMTYKIPSVPCD